MVSVIVVNAYRNDIWQGSRHRLGILVRIQELLNHILAWHRQYGFLCNNKAHKAQLDLLEPLIKLVEINTRLT